MRCYLVAEYSRDFSILHQVLKSLNVDVITPERIAVGSTGGGWIPDVDFVIAVFPARGDWETPAAVYLDIGVAVGLNTPVLIIAEPPRRLDAALSPLTCARIPLESHAGLASGITRFLRTIESPPPSPAGTEIISLPVLDSFKARLENLDAANPAQSGQAFHDLIMELLRTGGAELQESRTQDGWQVDASGYVPGTEDLFQSPLLVEIKLLRDSPPRMAHIQQVAGATAARDAAFGILIWHQLSGELGDVKLPPGAPVPVMIFSVEELLRRLSEQTLSQVIRNERSAIIHGGHGL